MNGLGSDHTSALLRDATLPRTVSSDPLPARFALELRAHQDPAVVGTMVEQALTDLRARVTPLSALDPEMLVLDLLDRVLDAARPAACFAAGYALAEQFDLVGAEPDLPTAFFPEQGADPSERASGWCPRGLPARLLRRPAARARTHARVGARSHARTRRLGLLRTRRSTEPRQGRHRRATGHGDHRARRACRRRASARLRRHRQRRRPHRPVDRTRQPRARNRNRQRPGLAGQLCRHGLGPPGAAHADPHHRERGADQTGHGRSRHRLGDPGRSPRRHHEPGRHPRQRAAPRDQPSSRG